MPMPGSFQLENIPVGTHAILLSLENHQSNELRGIVIKSEETIPWINCFNFLYQGTSGTFLREGRRLGIHVMLGGQSGLTSDNGSIHFDNVTAGSLTISAPAKVSTLPGQH